jgi:nitrogen fixation protein FixH
MRTRFNWNWFPAWLIGAMAMVFLVNAYMVYVALASFPGNTGKDGFELSNDYDRVLAEAGRQAALGWRLDAGLDAARRPVLRVTDRAGQPVAAEIVSEAERPVGPPETTELRFHMTEAGRYAADATLGAGQWDVLVTVRSGQRTFTATKRIVVN